MANSSNCSTPALTAPQLSRIVIDLIGPDYFQLYNFCRLDLCKTHASCLLTYSRKIQHPWVLVFQLSAFLKSAANA